jgi:hypothetical protein
MTDLKEYASYYIEQLGGPEKEDAFHSLIEADDAIIPILIDAFRSEQDPGLRLQLVEIIWQHRLPDTIKFLSEVLNDPAQEVWRCALDGLVAIGGQSAIQVLETTKQRIHSDHQAKSDQTEWIDEAIQQIRDQDETITKKTVQVDLSFRGDGSVVEVRPNVWSGGVVAPKIGDNLNFNVRRQVPDEEGVLNPIIGEETVEGSFQINIWGESDGYRKLGQYLLAVAEIDTGTDPSFHAHHEIVSGDGRTHLHIIVRKPTRDGLR